LAVCIQLAQDFGLASDPGLAVSDVAIGNRQLLTQL
jgi:hypothetical protein